MKLLFTIVLFLVWDAPGEGSVPDWYRVYYGVDEGDLCKVCTVYSCWAVIEIEDEQVARYYEVVAGNESGESDPSNRVRYPHFDLRLSRDGVLSWDSLTFESYEVWYSTDLIGWQLLCVVSGNSVDVGVENRFYRICVEE